MHSFTLVLLLVKEDKMTQIEEDLGIMTLQKAALKFEYKPRTLRQWVADGKIRGKKLGRNLWVYEEEVKQQKYGSFLKDG